MYKKVTSDLLEIASRLTEINKDYRVFYNNRDLRFEVHTSDSPSIKTLGFVVPFDKLDSRTIEYAYKSRKQNANAIEAEILEHNAQVEQSAQTQFDIQTRELENMLIYANKASHDVTFTKTKNFI